MVKKLYLIVVNVTLATIVSCSSVKKTKTITETTEQSVKTSDSSTSTKENTTNNSTGTANFSAERKGLQIDYIPTFDTDGKLIPFSFKGKDANGSETTVDITGSGTVKYFTENQVENMVNTLQEAYSKQIDSVNSKVDKVDSEITTKEKTKIVAPDYIKYIIVLGIGVLLLIIGIVVLYFYFRNKIKSITNLIP